MAAPVPHTCPDIDKIIAGIRAAIKYTNHGQKETEKDTDAHDYFDCIENELYRLEDMLEELRSDNSSLRDWGTEQEGEILSLQTIIEELENKISDH